MSKKRSVWKIIKVAGLSVCASGFLLFPALGISGSRIYQKAEQKIQKLLTENGCVQELKFDEDEAQIDEFMKTSEEVSKEELLEYNKALEKDKIAEKHLYAGWHSALCGIGAGFIGAFAGLMEEDKKERNL